MNHRLFSIIIILGSGMVIGSGAAHAANLTVFNVVDGSPQDLSRNKDEVKLVNYPIPMGGGMTFSGTVVRNINSNPAIQEQSIIIKEGWIETGSTQAKFFGDFVRNTYQFTNNIIPAYLSFTIYGTIESKVSGGKATGAEKLDADLTASNFQRGKQPLSYRSTAVPTNASLPRTLSRRTDSTRGILPAGSGTMTSKMLELTLGPNQRLVFPRNMPLQATGAVPEPSAIMGAITGLGFGAFFKRKLFKKA